MRLPLMGLALVALAGLTPVPASAEIGYMTRYHYEACTCTFGYPENACVVKTSCLSEGGHCLAPCHEEAPQSPAVRVR